MRNEQLDGFQYGESNLRGTAYENGGLEGSRATVHEKAPAYRVMNKKAGTGMRGNHVTCINFVATRIRLKNRADRKCGFANRFAPSKMGENSKNKTAVIAKEILNPTPIEPGGRNENN